MCVHGRGRVGPGLGCSHRQYLKTNKQKKVSRKWIEERRVEWRKWGGVGVSPQQVRWGVLGIESECSGEQVSFIPW